MRIRYISTVLILLLLAATVTGCRNNDNGNANNDDSTIGIVNIPGVSDDFDIEKYIYMPREIDMDDFEGLIDPVGGTIAHGDHIVFWYHDFTDIIIVKLTSDGYTRQETHIQGPDNLYGVKGLSITDDGHYAMVATAFNADDEMTIYYLIYDEQGEETEKQELLTIPGYFSTFTSLEHVVITDTNIVAVTVTDNNYTIHLLESSGEKLGEIVAKNLTGIVRLRDDRIVALSNEGSSSSLREIDFTSGGWGESRRLEISYIEQIIPADTTPYYDFLINIGDHLIGYVLETDTQTLLINWLESGTIVTRQYHIGMLANKDIFALYSGYVPTTGRPGVLTDLTVLTRSLRSDSDQQKTVITIGGTYVSPYLRIEVARFNSENPDYQIEINEYSLEDGLSFEANLLRMNVEMMAGRGPDIIVDSNFDDNISFMADLYPFIDADPVINRADFFQNVLQASERSGGKLPFISNTFTINTMLAKRENVELLTPFTFDTILQHVDESDPNRIAGRWLSWRFFIGRAYSSFIDWDKKQANIDNEEFINMFEIAARLPDDYVSAGINLNEENRRLRNGEQLLLDYTLRDLEWFRRTKAEIGDIVVMGEPTFTGGQNIVRIGGSVGIYAMSPNQDVAWSFIRRLLLPDARFNTNTTELPLRIDIFEEQIAELMIKEFWDEDIPMLNAVKGEEKPRSYAGTGFPGTPIFAMTEEEAQEIRAIIDSAVVGLRSDHTVWAIVEEEFHNFNNGLRSSADTARIIQNRVQTYLNEQG